MVCCNSVFVVNNELRISEEMFEKKMWVGLDLLERKF